MESYGIFRFTEETNGPEQTLHKIHDEESVPPVPQQNSFTSIGHANKEPVTELEDDNMTEVTSHTGDDVVSDVFRVPPLSVEEDGEDNEEEQIVWDLGSVNCPHLTPQ